MRTTRHIIITFPAMLILLYGCTTEQPSTRERGQGDALDKMTWLSPAEKSRMQEDRLRREAKEKHLAQPPDGQKPPTIGMSEERTSTTYALMADKVPGANDQSAIGSLSEGTNVTVSIRPEFLSDGRVRICGETDLPQGTELLITVEEQAVSGFIGQSKCSTTEGGRFLTEPFGPPKGLTVGLYAADVVMPIARLQPPAVRRVIGEKGERLTGPLVERDALGVSVRSSTQFMVGSRNVKAIQESSNPSLSKSVPSNSMIDVTYSVLNTSVMPGVKRSLDVRLSRRVSESTLRDIALKLKANDARSYERTFICYYLPDMEVGHGAWATSHFDPELEVKIIGVTIEEQERLTREVSLPVRENVLGRWIDNETGFPGVIVLLNEDGKVFMTQTFTDGSKGKYEMVVYNVAGQTRYRWKNRATSDYLVITAAGDLAHGDDEGIWATSKKAQ
jgi:hypothetical protein